MRAAIHVNGAAHQSANARAMRAGLERHGVEVVHAAVDVPVLCDFAVIWGWRQPAVSANGPTLVMERGYIGDLENRRRWTSLGWDGLNGRARRPSPDAGERWDAHFETMMQAPRDGGAYVLLAGQCRGDRAVAGTNIALWARDTARQLQELTDLPIRFRPHPQELSPWDVHGVATSDRTLAEDLAEAAFVVTFNSNAGVDAALAGVPVVAVDEGAMAWPIAAHELTATPVLPGRRTWATQLAFCQWTAQEIETGEAWEALRECMTAD